LPSPSLSIWEKQTFYPHQDIIVVGAGLMGLWSALELKKRDQALRITVIERSPTPLGASTRNAGFACFGSPTELLHNAATMGVDAMLGLVQMRYRGIEKIRSCFTDAQIGFDPCGGYECINRDYTGWEQLEDKTGWLNEQLRPITGSDQIFRRVDEKLPALGLRNFDALIENVTEAALHSGQLVSALTGKLRETGVQVLTGMELTGWSENDSAIRIDTLQGISLSAGQVLFCTNGFSKSLFPQLDLEPARGQVIVTSPIPALPLKGTFHFDEGFYYWRNFGDRILLGGARNTAPDAEHTTDLAGSQQIRQALEDFLARHLDQRFQYTIDHHWSGIMAFTGNRLPMIGKISARIHAAIACNGMGVALTPLVAEQAASLLI